jgi:hypothetical protein
MSTAIVIAVLVLLVLLGGAGWYFLIKKPDVDCVESSWGVCDETKKVKLRTITTASSGNGKKCGLLEESCIPNIDCVQSVWGVCDPTTKLRTRTTTTKGSGTGEACGILSQDCTPLLTKQLKVVTSAVLKPGSAGYSTGETNKITGLYDILGTGKMNDYCAFVGDAPNVYLQCINQTDGSIVASSKPALANSEDRAGTASFIANDNTIDTKMARFCLVKNDTLNCTKVEGGKWGDFEPVGSKIV